MEHRKEPRGLSPAAVIAAWALTTSILAAASPATALSPEPRVQGSTRGDVVRMWNEWAGEAATAACIAPTDNPLTESRAYALMHVAVHDALNAIQRRFEPYAYDGRAPRGASVEAAVAGAAHGVLVPAFLAIPAPFPAECGQMGAALIDSRYQRALADIPAGPARTAGLAVGAAAASAVLKLRADDGSDSPLVDPNYPQGTAAGQWRFTPNVPFAFGPNWGDVDPFVLASADQFLPPPPPDLGSAQYTRDFLEVKRLGGDGVTTFSERTDEQSEVAQFWVESSPLAWNRIAREIAGSRRLDEWASARMFGLLNMAMADGYIASFTSKYHYRYWRPVTAIREAAADGNPNTVADPGWTPLVTTPPIPDYESAHAVEGAAAAAVLRGVLGTDRVRFAACSLTVPDGGRCSDPSPVLRSFTRLSQAAVENGESRVLVGFHFRTAVTQGLRRGTAIGHLAVTSQLQRVPSRW